MCQHPAMKNELLAWIMEKRTSVLCVTLLMIQTQALRILPNGTFSASNGWFDTFMKHMRLTIRGITASGRELPRDGPIHTNKFLTECEPYMQMDFDRCHTMSWEVMDCHFNKFLKLFCLFLDIFLRFSHKIPSWYIIN